MPLSPLPRVPGATSDFRQRAGISAEVKVSLHLCIRAESHLLRADEGGHPVEHVPRGHASDLHCPQLPPPTQGAEPSSEEGQQMRFTDPLFLFGNVVGPGALQKSEFGTL